MRYIDNGRIVQEVVKVSCTRTTTRGHDFLGFRLIVLQKGRKEKEEIVGDEREG